MRSLFSRVVPKSSLKPTQVAPPPLTQKQEKVLKEPLIEIMRRRQKEAGNKWPLNLRIEPIIPWRAIGSAPRRLRPQLKKLLTER
ncbi:hypothetical protein F5I97DRAFT_613281 [Phlebopus sp. FC_14]|nr:hypothetical protein F5I97DRAFT_613281 [Phlebopus sp. FC_14]